jgi:hypothetical protein
MFHGLSRFCFLLNMYPYMSPVPPPSGPPRPNGTRQYFIGLGIGFIPLIVALISVGGLLGPGGGSSFFLAFLQIAGILYVGTIIGMIVCLSIAEVRNVGFGLLTMVAAIPVIIFVGCVALLSYHPY